MKQKLTLALFVFFSFMFSSCSVTTRTYTLPDEIIYDSSSESGRVSSDVRLRFDGRKYIFLSKYFQHIFPFQYEDYGIEIFLRDIVFQKEENTMLYMYIDECRISLPSGRVIDLLNNKILVNYTYTGSDSFQRAPPKILQNVKPQHTEDSRKKLYLDSISGRDAVRIEFNAKIPSSAQTIRLEYTLTVVWEDLGEVKIHKKLLFNKKSHTFSLFTV